MPSNTVGTSSAWLVASYILGTAAQPRRVFRGILFVLVGMFLHFTWDDAAGLGGGNGLGILAVMVGSIILALVILSIAFRLAALREHEFVRDLLAPEVVDGAITEVEVEAMVDRKARKSWLSAAPAHRERRARKHLRRALFDLVHAIARTDDDKGKELEHARNEVLRLRIRAKG
jgi:hypothetical protein